MATEQSLWQPDWAVAPGEILAEALHARGMTQSELARRLDRPVKTINEIVNGKAAITPDTALQLERALGISARLWNGLENQYREHLARQRADRELEDYAVWAKDFPVRDLVRHGAMREASTKGGRVAAVLSFFRVSNPKAWARQWTEPSAAFRASPTFMSSPKAVAAWLRWGELQAEPVQVARYDAGRFRHVVAEIRGMTRREPFMQVIERMREMCASAGVILVLTPELTGTRLSGAARWLAPDRALIQLSLRHKANDHFWFSFFHEAGHILVGSHRDYVDADEDGLSTDSEEEKADRFARDTLIPPANYVGFVEAGDFSEDAVKAFARRMELAAGIVVGRLQHDRHIEPPHLMALKKPIRWPRAMQ